MIPIFLFLACDARLPGGQSGSNAWLSHEDSYGARFVGNWFVNEEVAHALSGSTVYEFDPTGDLNVLWDEGLYEGGPQFGVRSPDRMISCTFGNRWGHEDLHLLVIEGECSDGQSRDIRIGFSNDSRTDQENTTTNLISVDGSSDWSKDSYGWTFVKCPDGHAAMACKDIFYL